MKIKKVFRVARFGNGHFFKFNLFRILFAGHRKCVKLAFQPRVFRWEREKYRGWNMTLLGLRVTYEYSDSGYLV